MPHALHFFVVNVFTKYLFLKLLIKIEFFVALCLFVCLFQNSANCQGDIFNQYDFGNFIILSVDHWQVWKWMCFDLHLDCLVFVCVIYTVIAIGYKNNLTGSQISFTSKYGK